MRLVADHGVDHPAPEVLPRSPLHLVVHDCEGLEVFNVDDMAHAEFTVALHWWDPGVEENRTLTIVTDTPSCRAHPGIARLATYGPG